MLSYANSQTENQDQAPQADGPRPKTIGLCMIVRNEAHCIVRCLSSVKGLVDYVLIVDTGSSDGTQEIVGSFLKANNIPGAVIDEPWRDFAWNRTFALQELRKLRDIDYGLMIDADEEVFFKDGFDIASFKLGLTESFYHIPSQHFGILNLRPQLFRNDLDFSFRGILHEYLHAPEGSTNATVHQIYTKAFNDSARNKNPRKYKDDAELLEKALKSETDPFFIARYTFYLAQSYHDAGDKQLALETYLKRAEQGLWIEEVYISLYLAAKLKEDLEASPAEIIGSYLKAYETVPVRVEALHDLAVYCRKQNQFNLAYLFARQGINLGLPENSLFSRSWMYEYGILDEYAVAAYWTGNYADSAAACRKLLTLDGLSKDYRERIQKNLDFALEKLRRV